jgi:predicted RNase H-like HicB family nuclease
MPVVLRVWTEIGIMITEYVEEALKRAKYEIINDEEPYYGEIEKLKGIWSTGETLEKGRSNLKDAIEGWILLSIKKGIPIPKLGDVEIKEILFSKVHMVEAGICI